jgi:peroxiredoxin
MDIPLLADKSMTISRAYGVLKVRKPLTSLLAEHIGLRR